MVLLEHNTMVRLSRLFVYRDALSPQPWVVGGHDRPRVKTEDCWGEAHCRWEVSRRHRTAIPDWEAYRESYFHIDCWGVDRSRYEGVQLFSVGIDTGASVLLWCHTQLIVEGMMPDLE